ncbi:MAG TPA: tail fiber domain-containing protein, partial [Pyrinomonadaceae bacterium]|nr:tail fiber domain-containing protein [Pyrinomonadaceae bacterium]
MARFVLTVLAVLAILSGKSYSQTTSFTYQGSLTNNSTPAGGSFDFEFLLFDAVSGGNQVGSTQIRNAVAVSNGTFSVDLDFGSQFPGANRFLEIRVRPSGGGGHTILSPRQKIASSPYSVKSLNAESAATATNAVQLGGLAANQYVLTGDSRMTDARNPLPGNPNYIQNQNAAPQASSNFNISGIGKAGVFDAEAHFSIGGSRVLGVTAAGSTFIGRDAGSVNTGLANTFVGNIAGTANTIGERNAFVGSFAGRFNTIGTGNTFVGFWTGHGNIDASNNSYFGRVAGEFTNGPNNSFFGAFAGQGAQGISTGSNNSFFGFQAGQSNTLGSFNAFFGYNAGRANTASDNAFFGASSGTANTTGTRNSFFGDRAGNENTTANDNSFFGYWSGRSSTGAGNSFFGAKAGSGPVGTSTGSNNSFFGFSAGESITTGSDNTFIGKEAGFTNTASAANTFVGSMSGYHATGTQNSFVGAGSGQGVAGTATGSFNSFFGYFAGNDNSTGTLNAFLGANTGDQNSSGSRNVFLGAESGTSNTIGSHNVFVGNASGLFSVDSDGNTFVGTQAGFASSGNGGGYNVALGALARVSTGVINAAAIGYKALATQSDSLVLGSINGVNGAGSSAKVGIGTTSPTSRLHVHGNTAGSEITTTGGFAGLVLGDRQAGHSAWILYASGGELRLHKDAADRFVVSPSGTLSVALGSAGSTAVCYNAAQVFSTCSSSQRYKSNILDFTSGLDTLRALRPVSFTWKEGGKRDLGFIAEEVAEIEPLLTFRSQGGEIEGVNYPQISTVLVNAIKEQQFQIEQQNAVIAE